MSTEQVTSLIALLATSLCAGSAVWLCLQRLRSAWAVGLLVACLWVTFLASWWLIDVNFPVSESHYRYAAGRPPLWLVIGVWFFRFSALASLIMMGLRRRPPDTSVLAPNRDELIETDEERRRANKE